MTGQQRPTAAIRKRQQSSLPPSGARYRHEIALLAWLALVAALLWGFVRIADAWVGAGNHGFDEALLLTLRNPADLADPIGPHWLEMSARDITALGGIPVLALVTLAACGFLLMLSKRRTTLLLLAAIGGGLLLSTGLKELFDRPRPELVPHAVQVATQSFPSSHAMMSAATYLTLGALLARTQQRRRLKGYLLAMAVLLTLLIGTSRVYLGVHWPTDVLAGWWVGAAWAMLCWSVLIRLQRRGTVERGVEREDGADPAG